MKLTVKIIKMGSAFFGIQLPKDDDVVWGKFQGDGNLTAEQQHNYAKKLFETNADGEVEIEYTQAEGKKGLKITSIKEIKDGKPVEPTKEQTVATKPDTKKTKDIATPYAKKQGSKPGYVPNDTQNSIERQQASITASTSIQVLAGHINGDNLDVLKKAYEIMFDAALVKIQNK